MNNICAAIRQSRARTIAFVASAGVVVYLIFVLLFATMYFSSRSIGYSSGAVVEHFSDAFYFSFVSFMTIGYGDIAPINGLGKFILLIETICSLLFTGTFTSALIYFALRRPDSLLFTSRLLITKDDSGEYILKLRVANRGGDITNCEIAFNLLAFTNEGARLKSHMKLESFPLLESDTVNVVSFSLEQTQSEKLLSTLQELLAKKRSKVAIRVNLTGLDAATGTFISVKKFYSETDIVFGYNFRIVGFWTEENLSRPIWKNFNQMVEDADCQLRDFLNIKSTVEAPTIILL
jgi:hypothetical protein